MSPEELVERVVEACTVLNQQGWTIVTGCFGSQENKTVGPLTSLLLMDNLYPWCGHGYFDCELLAYYLEMRGISVIASDSFWEGFDSDKNHMENKWFAAGYEVRTQLITKGLIKNRLLL